MYFYYRLLIKCFFFSNVTKYVKTQLTRDTLISNLIYFSYFRLIHVLKAELELCETLQEFTWLGKYFSSNQIHDELFRLRKEYPDLVKLVNVGKSYEKQDMLGIEVRCRPQRKWKLRSTDEHIQKIRYQKGKVNVNKSFRHPFQGCR